jgi:hypothetical protein
MMGKIKAMVKMPGEGWVQREIDNTLESLQGIVGGYIETLTLREGLVLIVNEEGVLHELAPNLYVRGHWLRGPIIAVGVRGEDFADCPVDTSWKMRIAVALENAKK